MIEEIVVIILGVVLGLIVLTIVSAVVWLLFLNYIIRRLL